ncbi:MAG: hypothetical protein OEW15_07960 [Nitrospirota bacterium]|nr:hypothetical protein [Nitrospirota bacterium]
MVGSKYYEKRSRVYLFLALYGVLAGAGIVHAVYTARQGKPVAGGSGFMIVFGAGMAVRTFLKSRKPLAVLHEERLELNQTNKAEYIRYKDIVGTEQPDEKQLVVKARDGHATRKNIIWLSHFEKTDSERLAKFLTKKGWKR